MSTSGTPATGRERFTRTGGGNAVQGILSFGGAAAFFGFTIYLLGLPAPMFLIAVMPAFFGVMLLVGGIAAFGRGSDPTVIEVGPDGAWFPGLGWRRWAEFRDIRVEHATGPNGTGTSTWRRLGFVPLDPTPAEQLPLAERLGATMVTGFYRFTSLLMGNRPVEFAPFGVQEVEIGHEPFERLLALVAGRVQVGAVAERPAGEPERGVVQAPGYLPRAFPVLVTVAARTAPVGVVLAMMATTVGAWPGGWTGSIPGVVFVVAVGLAFGLGAVTEVRRARRAGAAIVPLAVALLLGCVGGAVAGYLFLSGVNVGGR